MATIFQKEGNPFIPLQVQSIQAPFFSVSGLHFHPDTFIFQELLTRSLLQSLRAQRREARPTPERCPVAGNPSLESSAPPLSPQPARVQTTPTSGGEVGGPVTTLGSRAFLPICPFFFCPHLPDRKSVV